MKYLVLVSHGGLAEGVQSSLGMLDVYKRQGYFSCRELGFCYLSFPKSDKIGGRKKVNMTDLFSKIKEVTEISAISAHEGPVRTYLREKMTPHVDEMVTDGLGGLFGIKHSNLADAPRVLVASHMDEVGFLVSEIKACLLYTSSYLLQRRLLNMLIIPCKDSWY